MPENRTATVRPVEEHEATGKVAAIFADIKKTKNIDFVPAIWRTLATNPVQLEVVWTSLKTLMHPEATGRTSAPRSHDPRDHRPGRFGDERMRLLHQFAHDGPAQAGRRSRNARRDHGHRRPLQHDQRASQRLSDRTRHQTPARLNREDFRSALLPPLRRGGRRCADVSPHDGP